MRTLVSLGILACSLAFFSNAALAGDVEECEVLIGGTPGLYGLCIAYANAGNDNARGRILDNYDKKKQPGDPDLPGLFEGGAVCPCWVSAEYLAEITDGLAPTFCRADLDDSRFELVFYTGGGQTVNLSAGLLPGDPYAGHPGCVINDRGDLFLSPVSAAEDEACRAGIEALIDLDFGETCP